MMTSSASTTTIRRTVSPPLINEGANQHVMPVKYISSSVGSQVERGMRFQKGLSNLGIRI